MVSRTDSKPTIFINYRRIDSGWPASYLAERIEETFGENNLFLDVRSIDAGDDFSSKIEDSIQRAEILFVLIGRKWLFVQDKYGRRKLDTENDWVRREIKEGLENNDCRVIPILLDDAELPNEEEAVDDDISKLIKLQRLRLRQSNSDSDIEHIFSILDKSGFNRIKKKPHKKDGIPKIVSGIFDAPKFSDNVARPHLIEEIRSAILSKPVVVVGGLSGSGKTYLMSSYTEENPENHVDLYWYDPSPGESVDNLLSQFSSIHIFGGLSTVSRCKELISFLGKKHAILIIDDFHLVERSSYSLLIESAMKTGLVCKIVLLSQYNFEIANSFESTYHLPISGYSVEETKKVLDLRGEDNELDSWAEDLHKKCDGLPFAVSLFCSLVVEFNHSPKDLLSGSMTEVKRIKDWYTRIIKSIEKHASVLLPYLCLLIGPFNIGVIKKAAKDLRIENVVDAIDELQRAYLVTRYSPYRWKVHDLIARLSASSLSQMEEQRFHGFIGEYYLRGIYGRPSIILETKEFLEKVKAYRHLRLCTEKRHIAEKCLNQLTSTAKANGSYQLLLELSGTAIYDWHSRSRWIDYHYAHCLLILGDPGRSIDTIEPLLYGESLNVNETLRLNCNRLYAETLGSLGEEGKAIEILKESMHSINIDRVNKVTLAHAKNSLSWLLRRAKKFDEATSINDQLLSDAHLREDIRGGAIALTQKALIDIATDEHSDIEGILRHALELFENCADRRGQAWCLSNLTEYQVVNGDVSKAAITFVAAKRIAADIGECGVDYIELVKRLSACEIPVSFKEEVFEENNRIALATEYSVNMANKYLHPTATVAPAPSASGEV